MLLGPKSTMVLPKKPLISITAVRTGSGKSQTTRRVCDILKAKGRSSPSSAIRCRTAIW